MNYLSIKLLNKTKQKKTEALAEISALLGWNPSLTGPCRSAAAISLWPPLPTPHSLLKPLGPIGCSPGVPRTAPRGLCTCLSLCLALRQASEWPSTSVMALLSSLWVLIIELEVDLEAPWSWIYSCKSLAATYMARVSTCVTQCLLPSVCLLRFTNGSSSPPNIAVYTPAQPHGSSSGRLAWDLRTNLDGSQCSAGQVTP